MAGLDGLAPVPEAGAQETPSPGRDDGLVDPVGRARGLRDDAHRQGSAAHRHHLEQAPRVVRQAFETLRHHLSEAERVEGHSIGPAREVGVVTHELFDQKRAPPRLAGRRPRRSLRHLVRALEKREGEALGVGRIEGTHGDVVRLGAVGPARVDLLEERAGLRLFLPVRHHVENRRRIRRTHQLEEK